MRCTTETVQCKSPQPGEKKTQTFFKSLKGFGRVKVMDESVFNGGGGGSGNTPALLRLDPKTRRIIPAPKPSAHDIFYRFGNKT